MKKVYIKEKFIKLDSALKLASAVGTGGHAKIVIKNGEVAVNGEICLMRGKKLYSGDVFIFEGQNFVIENEN